jgi:hypothetical protein
MTMTSNQLDSCTAAFLLRMADAQARQNDVRQAEFSYLKILSEYRDSEQAGVAQSALLNIAYSYEHQGLYRLAQAIFERLDEANLDWKADQV